MAEHGTVSRYQTGKCRCDPCKAANTENMRAYRERFKKYPADKIPHGAGGYRNYGCRCAVCSKAHAAFLVDGRKKRQRDKTGTPHGTQSGFRYWGCRCKPCCDVEQARQRGINDKTREKARRHGEQWTGPELELLARADLGSVQIAEMLGRTRSAVRNMRRRLQIEPMLDHVAGVPR